MPSYYVNGTLTFSNQTNRNGAQADIETYLAGAPEVVPWAGGTYAAGLNRSGATVLTVAFECPDEASAANAYAAFMSAIASRTRSAGHLAVSRAGT